MTFYPLLSTRSIRVTYPMRLRVICSGERARCVTVDQYTRRLLLAR